MVLGFCCQREGLHRSLYLVHIFILAGAGYYYFQMYMGKPALDYENAEKSTQPKGETVRPVWGLMDKCYPAPAQASPQTTAPKEEEAQNDTTPQEETDSVSQEEGQEKKMVQQEVAVHPSGPRLPGEQGQCADHTPHSPSCQHRALAGSLCSALRMTRSARTSHGPRGHAGRVDPMGPLS
ncbi:uncharacterized protein LOC122123540 isoform X2 [Dipodomys spectabilis]|uniref:uncharacterized protein LOC122123540 isoform X2 n=1 Tax=Dipodomys spectabilis TaxID=105255 RepID=UPI001C53BFC7|nr:uncharacterized protein LOC122123540 isoform X2 [Dipodomys spectabilis]